MKKIILPLIALLFLLSSCSTPANDSAASSQPVPEVDVPEVDVSEVEETSSQDDILNDHLFHYGETFDCFRTTDNLTQLSPLPTDPITSSVMDFDQDGEDEQLLISIVPSPDANENGSSRPKYTLRLSMFEQENGKYVISADKTLSEERIYLPLCEFSWYNHRSSSACFLDCFTYGEEQTKIAVEVIDKVSGLSIIPGAETNFTFASFVYNGKDFELLMNDTFGGTGMMDETDSYAIMLKDAGIDLDIEEYFIESTFISDHVENYNCLLFINYVPLCTYEQAVAWSKQQTKDTPLKYATAFIYTQNEMDFRSSLINNGLILP